MLHLLIYTMIDYKMLVQKITYKDGTIYVLVLKKLKLIVFYNAGVVQNN